MLDKLIGDARAILNDARHGSATANEFDLDGDRFLLKVNDYLDAFDLWRAEQGDGISDKLTDVERGDLLRKLKSLQELHLEVMALTESLQGDLRNRLGDVSRRAKALRSYVDHYPSRINITGRRKG